MDSVTRRCSCGTGCNLYVDVVSSLGAMQWTEAGDGSCHNHHYYWRLLGRFQRRSVDSVRYGHFAIKLAFSEKLVCSLVCGKDSKKFTGTATCCRDYGHAGIEAVGFRAWQAMGSAIESRTGPDLDAMYECTHKWSWLGCNPNGRRLQIGSSSAVECHGSCCD